MEQLAVYALLRLLVLNQTALHAQHWSLMASALTLTILRLLYWLLVEQHAVYALLRAPLELQQVLLLVVPV